MLEITQELNNIFTEEPNRIIISNKSIKDFLYNKVEARKIILKGKLMYQFSTYTDKQVFQSNVSGDELVDKVVKYFPDNLKQINIFFEEQEVSLKLSKSGKLLKHVSKKNIKNTKLISVGETGGSKEHNRKRITFCRKE